jgi:exopolysaccharide biosynthesis polyprenyl glycosylphosphotransferase
MTPVSAPQQEPAQESAADTPEEATGAAAPSIRRDPEAFPAVGPPVRWRLDVAHQSPDVAFYLRLCRVSDIVIAVGLLLGLFVMDNLGRLPRGLDDFLGARVTVKNVLLVVVFAGCWHLSCRWVGLYDWSTVKSRKREVMRGCLAATVGTLIALIFPSFSASGAFRHELLPPFLALVAVLMLGSRAVLRSTTTAGANASRRVLIVGTGPRARALHAQLTAEGDGAPQVVGFVDSRSDGDPTSTDVVCGLDGLESFLVGQELDELLIALPVKSCYSEIQHVIQICERVGVPFKYSASLFTHARHEPRMEPSFAGPVLSVPASADGPWLVVKRGVDLIGSAAALLLLAPVLAAVALMVKLSSPGPVLFSQLRYGRHRHRFRMYKFRTMVQDAEARQVHLECMNDAQGPVFKIRRDPRITRVGALLRRTSLDELPQLWNVLRGDMSLVGPRPLPVRDVQHFAEAWLMRRFSVLPGITGLWQVSGRSDLGFDEWIRLDLAYIDQWSPWLDLSILARTIPAVLTGRGAT